MKKEFSIITYTKTILLIILYFYLFIHSAFSLKNSIQNGKDLINPLFGLLFCLVIAVYVLIGKKGKSNPLDKKVSPFAIAAVIILFFATVGFIYWYGTTR